MRRQGKAWVWALLALLVLSGGGAVGFYWVHEQHRRWEPIPMPERLARVPEKWPVEKLAERLQKNGKVRDAAAFLEAAHAIGLTEVAAGGYTLPEKAGPRELAAIFKAPPSRLKVTFPEGWTAAQMARRLAANGFGAADEFLRRAYPPGQLVSPWEGRLFPDTYNLPPREGAVVLARRLMRRFNQVAAALPRPLPPGPDGKPLTLDQVVTLASLVERETDVPAERPLIAGVLLNRLHKKMRLQCDASVQYARQRALIDAGDSGVTGAEGHKTRLLFRDLKIVSPYNTYLNAGLPPGPICNPGAESLRAAAAPRANPYLFYVMAPKLGRHRFAKTFAEHEKNIHLAKLEK